MIHGCRDRQTGRQAGRQTGRQTDRQTGRQIEVLLINYCQTDRSISAHKKLNLHVVC